MIYLIDKVYYNVTVKQKNRDLNIYYTLTVQTLVQISVLVKT